MFKLCSLFLLVGGVVNGADLKVLARFGEDSLSSGSRKIYFYSSEKLSDVSFRFEGVDSWTKLTANKETDGYYPWGTESYVQHANGSKFVFQGTTEAGTRVTYLATTVLSGKEQPSLKVELMTEETREQLEKERKEKQQVAAAQPAQAEGGYARLLAHAQSHIGRSCGGGGCNELCGNGGQQIGTITRNQYGLQITGSIVPGAVLDMRGYSITGTDGLTWFSGQHYAVVESYDPQSQTITILHQNFLGGDARGRFVRRDTLRLQTMNGTFYVKAGY